VQRCGKSTDNSVSGRIRREKKPRRAPSPRAAASQSYKPLAGTANQLAAGAKPHARLGIVVAMEGVEFRGVSYGFAGRPAVLDDFSLTVAAGETVALVGASGAGKTTVLRLVNRLLLPDAGEVRVQGRDTREWDPIRLRRSVGYVIQEVGLFPHLTVAGNIAVVPRLERWSEDRVAARVRELLELIGLEPDAYTRRWPDELSGGQRQRVGVARALAADPPVLLMDEPFGALDPINRRQLQQEFRRIQARVAKCVILVTHDMAEALVLGDRIGVMDAGRLIWSGTPQEILDSDDARVRALVASVLPVPRPNARTGRA
jgi:osmoprotectant transport system ATP-binding protein